MGFISFHFPDATFYRNARWCRRGCGWLLRGCWLLSWWFRLQPFPDCLALVVHTRGSNKQPTNPKKSCEREAGCFCVGVVTSGWSVISGLSRGVGTCGLCCCLFLSRPCQAVAFGKSFVRSHAARVLFRCWLCFGGISGHTGRGWRVWWGCGCGCRFFGNCLELLRCHRVYRGFKIFKVPTRFLQGSCQVSPRFCQVPARFVR